MILTETRLRTAAQEAHSKYEFSYTPFRFDEAETYDLFISHSFKDRELVNGIYHLFKLAGYKVYVDWIDNSNLDRKSVTPATAALIRKRIERSKGLAYIATSNISASKWCPWELGVSDGMHSRACILPIMAGTFKGQEYLGLYPYLEYAQIQGSEKYEFWVHDQQDTRKYIILNAWLNGSKPCLHN